MNAAPDLHTLTGAYAAHALPEGERAAFEGHLVQCPACAQEVAEFRAALARLGAAETVEPSPELRARVLRGIGHVRQLPPTTTPVVPPRRSSRPGRQWPKVALAACLALAAGSGALAVQQHERANRALAQASRLRDQQAAVASLLSAPDARTATSAAGPAAATVVWSPGRGQAAFLVTGMPALPQGRAYELWFDDAGTMRPAGLLPAGNGQLLLTGSIAGAVGVGVTEEPSGGSDRPTGQPLMLLPLT
ncbi:anti-sigma factor domain-containing protein [Kitasatospora sp. NPDC056184]|uniref:anti-sigma factor n=1 Tax=Kitasatospora sp. NPDC056184 TaxID=3345738 RepID=UPI0035D7F274